MYILPLTEVLRLVTNGPQPDIPNILNKFFARSTGSLTACYYHVTYAFQSKSTLYSCMNVKELLARNMNEI